jgi:pyruvate,orthophosphate dikinase
VLKGLRQEHIDAVLQPVIESEARRAATLLAHGEPACPGIGIGVAVGDADEAEKLSEAGQSVVLVRRSTSPEDVHGMIASAGICTEIGGRTSHAAVVSRELGRPAVVGCGEGALQPLVGQVITIDGASGDIYAGRLATRQPEAHEHPELARLAAWAADCRKALGEDHPLLAISIKEGIT